MMENNSKFSRTEVVFFNSFDNHGAKDAYTLWIRANEMFFPVPTCCKKIAVYFDEYDDYYQVTILSPNQKPVKRSVYSWDDLSQLIHDNM